MAKRIRTTAWSRLLRSSMKAMAAPAAKAGRRAVKQTIHRTVARAAEQSAAARRPPPGPGDWLAGVAVGTGGARRYRLYRPPGLGLSERVPLLVMLHGCSQDARSFAMATRMNRVADRERFIVLYPEQDRLANVNGCWNWFDTDTGRAHAEADLVVQAVDQACLFYPVDPLRIAIAGLSAGASMAALVATRHPGRFRAVVMHSGVPPGTAHSTATALGAMHGRRATVMPPPAVRRQAAPVRGLARSRAKAGLPPPTADTTLPWPPLLVIHGGADNVVSVRNGRAAVEAWATAAGAEPRAPRIVQRGKRYPMVVIDFRKGALTVSQLVEIGRLGHAWSGGAARQPYSDAQGPDASRLTWAFAERQWRSDAAPA